MSIDNDEVGKLLGTPETPSTPVDPNITPAPSASGATQVFEVNGQKYDLSKPEDTQRWATDYQNLEKEKSRLANENHELKVKSTPPATPAPQKDEEKGKSKTPDVDVDKLVDEKLAVRDYWKAVDEKVSTISSKYGVERQEVIDQLDEVGYYLKPGDIESFWIGKNTDKYEAHRQAELEKARPTTPYSQTSGSGSLGEEGSDSEVIRFGENVTARALEEIGITG